MMPIVSESESNELVFLSPEEEPEKHEPKGQDQN